MYSIILITCAEYDHSLSYHNINLNLPSFIYIDAFKSNIEGVVVVIKSELTKFFLFIS